MSGTTSKIFFTSDNHFNHAKIIEYCNRPFSSVEEMNETMIKNWNKVVGAQDIVYHLGDFAFGRNQLIEFKNKLNGKLILIVGNHDLRVFKLGKLKQIFDEAYKDLIIEIDGSNLYLSHCPTETPSPNIDFYLNGHVHQNWIIRDNCINVGVDVWNFTPITWQQIKQKI